VSGSSNYILGYSLGMLLVLGIVIAGVAVFWITFLSFTRDLWAVGFVFEQRRKLTTWVGVPLVVLLVSGGAALFGVKSAAVLFPTLALGPWITIKVVALWSWHSDSRDTRRAALEVRTAEALRVGAPLPAADRRLPWPGYIFDVARAEQRALYEPPPI
jgi:hypothetical protein